MNFFSVNTDTKIFKIFVFLSLKKIVKNSKVQDNHFYGHKKVSNALCKGLLSMSNRVFTIFRKKYTKIFERIFMIFYIKLWREFYLKKHKKDLAL